VANNNDITDNFTKGISESVASQGGEDTALPFTLPCDFCGTIFTAVSSLETPCVSLLLNLE
jgi:hypothetical protein